MTTPIVPDFILSLFQNEISKINLELLEKVCKLYKIDMTEAVKRLKDELRVELIITKDERIKIVRTRPELDPSERCIAIVYKHSILDHVQCSLRHQSEKQFCKRHQNMNDNGNLKYGTIHEKCSSKPETKTKTETETKVKRKLVKKCH